MNTININELDLNPKITESREFSSENIAELLDEVTEYLEEKFPGVYNPFTTRRLVVDNAKLEDGTTRLGRFETEMEKEKQDSINVVAARESKIEDIYKKYQPEKDALNAEFDQAMNKHVDMYFQKRKFLLEGEYTQEQLKELENEELRASDDLQWSSSKKRDELWKRIEEEVLAV